MLYSNMCFQWKFYFFNDYFVGLVIFLFFLLISIFLSLFSFRYYIWVYFFFNFFLSRYQILLLFFLFFFSISRILLSNNNLGFIYFSKFSSVRVSIKEFQNSSFVIQTFNNNISDFQKLGVPLSFQPFMILLVSINKRFINTIKFSILILYREHGTIIYYLVTGTFFNLWVCNHLPTCTRSYGN